MVPIVAMLVVGLLLAAAGGETFVRAIVELARGWQVPPAIVAATVAAFATSAPELAVSLIAALEGAPQIGLGDALGSNVVNIGLILGLALLLGPLPAERAVIAREVPFALAGPLLCGVLVADGRISRGDALLLLALFCAWLAVALRAALAHRRAQMPATDARPWRAGLRAAAGLALLFTAGHLIVEAARGLVAAWGVAPFLVGATLVAFGTSMPELVTTLVARLRGHDDVGLGTLLGSNLFNGLVIVPAAALIHPIDVAPGSVLVGLGFGALVILLVVPGRSGRLSRARGVALLAAYAGYLLLLARA